MVPSPLELIFSSNSLFTFYSKLPYSTWGGEVVNNATKNSQCCFHLVRHFESKLYQWCPYDDLIRHNWSLQVTFFGCHYPISLMYTWTQLLKNRVDLTKMVLRFFWMLGKLWLCIGISQISSFTYAKSFWLWGRMKILQYIRMNLKLFVMSLFFKLNSNFSLCQNLKDHFVKWWINSGGWNSLASLSIVISSGLLLFYPCYWQFVKER